MAHLMTGRMSLEADLQILQTLDYCSLVQCLRAVKVIIADISQLAFRKATVEAVLAEHDSTLFHRQQMRKT